MLLCARQFRYQFPRSALVMGILNVTPDSFSDGGRFLDPEVALDHALEMIHDGADIIDVGGESTRPRATPVPLEEELRRVMPVIERLAGRIEAPISIDTLKPEVASAALGAGAAIVNDVAANRQDLTMLEVVAEAGAGYVCMHMQGTPQTMQENPQYEDVLVEVESFFVERFQRLCNCGIAPERVIIDPGIGFGKTFEHNARLLAGLSRLSKMGRPLMIGVSRKSFIQKAAGARAEERLPGSLACACLAVESGANIVRVHDVAETVQALRMVEAILTARKQMEVSKCQKS